MQEQTVIIARPSIDEAMRRNVARSSYIDQFQRVPNLVHDESGKVTGHDGCSFVAVIDWKAHTYDRLRWAHGEDRARAIAMGIDPATNADLIAWRELGQ